MDSFGSRLKQLRIEKKLTQTEFGDKFNVHKGSVSNWENDNRFPDGQQLTKIADYFDVSIDYLLGRTNKRQPHHLTKEDLIKIAPEYAWLFEEGGLKYVELVDELKGKDIPPEAVQELVDMIIKYGNIKK